MLPTCSDDKVTLTLDVLSEEMVWMFPISSQHLFFFFNNIACQTHCCNLFGKHSFILLLLDFMLDVHIIPKHVCVCLFYTTRAAQSTKCVQTITPPASVIVEGF